ncbi:hypothetical protein CCR75_007549 [Bremia lactucae]|uniref:Uncharacterized protein n=1 Tax=Bremia lactucae TaxID=4779 RepID=A0A976IKV4_BRELC|nr:hypothetical protein CCR75_007549 [Bremia lactucae]
MDYIISSEEWELIDVERFVECLSLMKNQVNAIFCRAHSVAHTLRWDYDSFLYKDSLAFRGLILY